MRVALDVTPLLGARTGVARTVDGLLRALPAAAPEIEVVPYVLSGRARARGSRSAAVHGPGVRHLPLPASVAIRAWGRVDLPRVDRWLAGADVVHGTNFVVPPVRRMAAAATVHDCWCARRPGTCDPVARAFTPAVRRAVDRGAWLHVSTAFVAAEVREVYGAERVAVVPFGVPPGPAPPEPASPDAASAGPPFVLSIATAEPRKALDSLVRAFGLLAADPAAPGDLRLVLAGPPGPADPAVDAAVAALPRHLAERVDRPGAVGEPERVRLLHRAAVVAYPSRSEGFGFPVLEAMGAGTPVVATAAGAIPEVAADAAELVPVGDDAALAGALLRVLTDDALRGALVARGRTRVGTFTWERTARGLADLWTRLAAGAPA